MEPKHSPGYWIERLQTDSLTVGDEVKHELIKALLVYSIPLQPEEADFFLTSSPTGPEELLRYSSIEEKIADAYSNRSMY